MSVSAYFVYGTICECAVCCREEGPSEAELALQVQQSSICYKKNPDVIKRLLIGRLLVSSYPKSL